MKTGSASNKTEQPKKRRTMNFEITEAQYEALQKQATNGYRSMSAEARLAISRHVGIDTKVAA